MCQRQKNRRRNYSFKTSTNLSSLSVFYLHLSPSSSLWLREGQTLWNLVCRLMDMLSPSIFHSLLKNQKLDYRCNSCDFILPLHLTMSNDICQFLSPLILELKILRLIPFKQKSQDFQFVYHYINLQFLHLFCATL